MTGVDDALLPVGTIIAYAGAYSANLEEQGWLLCDGRAVDRAANAELWGAIGTAYGAPNDSQFNLPALAGMFLRGVAHGSDKDPSRADRVALRPGGNSGDSVGSLQPYGTAKPQSAFTAVIPKYDTSETKYDKGTAGRPYKWNGGSTTVEASGGDKETRPKNKYVYFIIKRSVRNVTGRVVQPPVGSVMPFAAPKNMDPAHWVLCDGKAVPTSGEFAALFAAIQFAHGQTNEGEMVLPDYCGQFLRGVSGSSGIDPDADGRTAPYPKGEDGKKGNSGNNVGSAQLDATGLPNPPFKTTFYHLPKDKAGDDGISGAIRYLVHGADVKTVTLTQDGGDDESRPYNLAIDWYIRAR